MEPGCHRGGVSRLRRAQGTGLRSHVHLRVSNIKSKRPLHTEIETWRRLDRVKNGQNPLHDRRRTLHLVYHSSVLGKTLELVALRLVLNVARSFGEMG
jgi:hypothetical protein